MLGCSIVRVGSATPVMHLDLLHRAQPTAVVGVPSFLGIWRTRRRKPDSIWPPRRAQAHLHRRTGSPAGLVAQSRRRAVEQSWGANVFSTYGNTELAASLCECEAGRGGHLHPELLHMEALDDAGQPVPEGQVGELTATTFGVEAMPLIRYRTGDCAAIFREPCACGRRTLRIGPIVGRKGQKLKIKGTTIFPSTLKAVLDAAPEISIYVIIARRDSDLSDPVEVRLACAADPAKTIAGCGSNSRERRK